MIAGAAVEEAKKSRVEGAERSELLEELGVKEKMLAAVTSEVIKYKECDPEVLGELELTFIDLFLVLHGWPWYALKQTLFVARLSLDLTIFGFHCIF